MSGLLDPPMRSADGGSHPPKAEGRRVSKEARRPVCVVIIALSLLSTEENRREPLPNPPLG